MTRSCKWVFLGIVVFESVWFFYISQQRLIDGDEGFYLLAARLVLEHRAPYLDFFYTQAPLLPYVYAGWLKLFPISWAWARAFSALLTVIVGALVFEHVCHQTKRWMAGVAATVLYCSSALVFAWFPTAKTFSLSAIFLFSTYVILTRVSSSKSKWVTALAGLLFGLSVDARSYIIAIVPVFLWWILVSDPARRAARVVWFLGGVVVGLTPSLVLFVASPDVFLFNNLGYHALRSDAGLIGGWRNKARIAWLLVIGNHTGFQFSLLSATYLALSVFSRARKDAALFAFLIAFALGLVCLLPTPSQLQYFSVVMPFLIAAVVCSASEFLAELRSPAATRAATVAIVICLASSVGFGVVSFREYLFTGKDVPGIVVAANAHNWTVNHVVAVSEAIDQVALPGEQIASFWPGFVFATRAEIYPGFENDFGIYIAARLSPEKREKYHVLTTKEIMSDFAHHGPEFAVVGNQGDTSGGPDYAATTAMVRSSGYTLVRKVGEAGIYKCCSLP